MFTLENDTGGRVPRIPEIVAGMRVGEPTRAHATRIEKNSNWNGFKKRTKSTRGEKKNVHNDVRPLIVVGQYVVSRWCGGTGPIKNRQTAASVTTAVGVGGLGGCPVGFRSFLKYKTYIHTHTHAKCGGCVRTVKEPVDEEEEDGEEDGDHYIPAAARVRGIR